MILNYSRITSSKMCDTNKIQSCFCHSCPVFNGQSLKPMVKINQKTDICNATNLIITGAEGMNFHLPQEEKSNLQILCKTQKTSASEAKMSSNRISSHLEGSVLGSTVKNMHRQLYSLQGLRKPLKDHFRNRGTQTDYRETESQTVPWEPPYQIVPGHNPEVLTLVNFTWGHGLPAGMHEMEIINRMRKKRAWEKILPPMDSPANIKMRSSLTTALEAADWAFREAEIQFIMNLRLDLAEKLMQQKEQDQKQKLEDRFKKVEERLSKRKHREIKKIRNKFSRELRKLDLKHRALKIQHNKRDIVKFDSNWDFEYFDPKPYYDCSQILKMNFLKEEFIDSPKNEVQLPSWLFAAKEPSYSAHKSHELLCVKKMKRNEKKLIQLSQNLESVNINIRLAESCNLLQLKQKMPKLPSTPRQLPDESTEEVDHSSHLLQKLVRGRAIQLKILEGRNRYRELIEELQSARALKEHSDNLSEQSHIKLLQKEEEHRILQEGRVNEILEALEGKTIAKMLNFLSDELIRLKNEKKAHALALLVDMERLKKEIAQASKEQLEVNRRRELDEIFRQILKINEESVETYLEDIVKEGVKWISEKEAEKYIAELASETDAITKYVEENAEAIDEEGLVSDIVYNFVLPEVEKESTRKRLRKKQRRYLSAAHASIYDEVLNIPEDKLLSDQAMSDRTHSSIERCTNYESDNEELDQLNLQNLSLKKTCKDKNSFKHIIETILSYAGIFDDKYKQDIYHILELLLCDANGKTNVLK